MSLPALFGQPEDASDWDGWGFNHAAIHYNLIPALQAKNPAITGMQQFQLYPIDMKNFDLWLYYHQTMHNQANLVLGTSGYDLLQLDLNDADAVAEWLLLNGDEHQRFNAALGVD